MSKHNKYDSDDDRYFYKHYKGENYYSSQYSNPRGSWDKIDLVIYILFVLFLIYIEISK